MGLCDQTRSYQYGYHTLQSLFNVSLISRLDVTGEWKKLHNQELNDLYSLPNTVRVVKCDIFQAYLCTAT
jgi:hypothetical protein